MDFEKLKGDLKKFIDENDDTWFGMKKQTR
jgi:hypothetical protein